MVEDSTTPPVETTRESIEFKSPVELIRRVSKGPIELPSRPDGGEVKKTEGPVTEDTVTHLVCSTFKGNAVAMGAVYPACGQGIIITSGESFVLEPMKRLNQKKLDALLDQCQRDINAKCGPWFVAVQKILTKHKVELA